MVSIKPDDNEDMRGKGMAAANGSYRCGEDEKEKEKLAPVQKT